MQKVRVGTGQWDKNPTLYFRQKRLEECGRQGQGCKAVWKPRRISSQWRQLSSSDNCSSKPDPLCRSHNLPLSACSIAVLACIAGIAFAVDGDFDFDYEDERADECDLHNASTLMFPYFPSYAQTVGLKRCFLWGSRLRWLWLWRHCWSRW